MRTQSEESSGNRSGSAGDCRTTKFSVPCSRPNDRSWAGKQPEHLSKSPLAGNRTAEIPPPLTTHRGFVNYIPHGTRGAIVTCRTRKPSAHLPPSRRTWYSAIMVAPDMILNLQPKNTLTLATGQGDPNPRSQSFNI